MRRHIFACMLVAQPRKVVFHPNALVRGRQSVEALIAAAQVVQMEVGPPFPGTYRNDFRIELDYPLDIDEIARLMLTDPGGKPQDFAPQSSNTTGGVENHEGSTIACTIGSGM